MRYDGLRIRRDDELNTRKAFSQLRGDEGKLTAAADEVDSGKVALTQPGVVDGSLGQMHGVLNERAKHFKRLGPVEVHGEGPIGQSNREICVRMDRQQLFRPPNLSAQHDRRPQPALIFRGAHGVPHVLR